MIQTTLWIQKWREAFGEKPGLPIAFGYSDRPMSEPRHRGHCLIGALQAVRKGETISFSAGELQCGGGTVYTGFGPMNDRIPTFVSQTERYKQTPGMVREAIDKFDLQPAPAPFLNFWRVDRAERMYDAEGLICFATPDMLAGLVNWACFDNTWDDAVVAGWGSGCSSIIAKVVTENRRQGHSCFLGMFDISARPYVAADELTFSIPMSRLPQMTETMEECFFHGAKAWANVKKRINGIDAGETAE